MDKNKAKKAVKKSESRKQQATVAEAMQMAQVQGMDPEIQTPTPDMQPPTVNPYHAMGAMAPTMYSAGNMLNGYNSPYMVNPET
jgi:hypothetical protein